MPRIIVYKGQKPLKRVNFRGGTQKVGRLKQCEISIEDVDIALEQAVVVEEGNAYYLEPLSFNPPIMIEGEEIRSPTELDEGYVISIGLYRLIFSFETDPVSEEPSPALGGDESTADREVGNPHVESRPIVAGASPQDRFAPPVRRFRSAEEIAEETASTDDGGESKYTHEGTFCLVAIAGPFEGELYDLQEGNNVIGSGSGCDIRLDRDKEGHRYGTIAASHASVDFRGGDWLLKACKSRHGTAHNGRLLPEGETIILGEFDEIEIRHAPEGSVFRFAKRGRLDISPPSSFEPAVYAKSGVPIGVVLAAVVILLLIVMVVLAYK
jgi:pSer/pThr/pTyr-binding forkhead associated (FHA) protein